MLRIMGKVEAFQVLRQKFDSLKPFDVIELCNDGRRFRAVVTEKDADGFFVVELTDELLSKLVAGKARTRVVVPNDAESVHPMWNSLRR